ncbi:MAG: lysostaphin resistance A-like protein [Saprospiraceae bacterium]
MFLQQVNQGKNNWWRWLLTILFTIIGYVIGQVPLFIVMTNAVTKSNDGVLDLLEVEELAQSMNFDAYGINPNMVLVMVLLMFVFAMLGLWFGVATLHKRPFRSLITPMKNINWSKIFFAFGLWTFFSLVLEGASYLMDTENYIFNFEAATFFPLLIIALTLLPIQTSFEEIFMRGYLMQGMSSWAPMRWIPLVLTSVIFGGMHIMNPEVREFGLGIMMTYYMGVGLFLGIITLMDDSLELALGVHAATNIFGALFVTFESSALQTPAIFRLKEVDVTWMIPVFFIAAAAFTFICAKKYGWTDWSNVYGPIQHPNNNAETELADSGLLDDSL